MVHERLDPRLKERLVNNSFRIFEYQTELFGVSVYDRYLAVFTPKADDGLSIWGGEHAYSQGNSIIEYPETLRIFSHQIFHRWNGWWPKGMDSAPGDIKWIVEGVDVYYEDKILLDLGIIERYSDTNLYRHWYPRYKEIAGTDEDMSIVEAGEHKTVTKPSTANFIIYRKGALVSMLIDLRIQELTNGEKSLNDVMMEMYKRYGEYKSSYTTADFLRVINEVSGHDFSAFFAKYVYGKELLPLEKYFGDSDGDGILNIDEPRVITITAPPTTPEQKLPSTASTAVPASTTSTTITTATTRVDETLQIPGPDITLAVISTALISYMFRKRV